jgi:hypothetical protein
VRERQIRFEWKKKVKGVTSLTMIGATTSELEAESQAI